MIPETILELRAQWMLRAHFAHTKQIGMKELHGDLITFKKDAAKERLGAHQEPKDHGMGWKGY